MLAEIDWGTVGTAAGTVAGILLTAFGAAAQTLLGHLRQQREAQWKHEADIMARVEVIIQRFDATVTQLYKDAREENRTTIETLLKIQGETVEAVAGLSGKVHELGEALSHLRAVPAPPKPKPERPAKAGKK